MSTPINAGFDVIFDEDITEEEATELLRALADYYRACGGSGLQIELASADAAVDPHAGTTTG